MAIIPREFLSFNEYDYIQKNYKEIKEKNGSLIIRDKDLDTVLTSVKLRSVSENLTTQEYANERAFVLKTVSIIVTSLKEATTSTDRLVLLSSIISLYNISPKDADRLLGIYKSNSK